MSVAPRVVAGTVGECPQGVCMVESKLEQAEDAFRVDDIGHRRRWDVVHNGIGVSGAACERSDGDKACRLGDAVGWERDSAGKIGGGECLRSELAGEPVSKPGLREGAGGTGHEHGGEAAGECALGDALVQKTKHGGFEREAGGGVCRAELVAMRQ